MTQSKRCTQIAQRKLQDLLSCIPIPETLPQSPVRFTNEDRLETTAPAMTIIQKYKAVNSPNTHLIRTMFSYHLHEEINMQKICHNAERIEY